jgi:hypothetical protein
MLPAPFLQKFIAKWRKVELKESSAAQEHFSDLCHLVSYPTPGQDDPTFGSRKLHDFMHNIVREQRAL